VEQFGAAVKIYIHIREAPALNFGRVTNYTYKLSSGMVASGANRWKTTFSLQIRNYFLLIITKINCLTLFNEIIGVYYENNTKHINTKCRVADCYSRWDIHSSLSFKGLRLFTQLKKILHTHNADIMGKSNGRI
jgi:hypothetical protein